RGEQPVVAVPDRRVGGERRGGLVRRVVGAGYRGAVEPLAGVGVGGLANDEPTWGWITGLVLNGDVVDLPPPAERTGEVVPELHRALAARLRDLHGLQDGSAHAVAGVLPDVSPRLPAIGAHVHGAGLAGEPEVVGVEAEDRVGHAGQVHHRGDQ